MQSVPIEVCLVPFREAQSQIQLQKEKVARTIEKDDFKVRVSLFEFGEKLFKKEFCMEELE